MECVILLEKYGVFGASECKRGIRGGRGGVICEFFRSIPRNIMAGLGWEMKLLPRSLEIGLSLRDRLNTHPFMNSCF